MRAGCLRLFPRNSWQTGARGQRGSVLAAVALSAAVFGDFNGRPWRAVWVCEVPSLILVARLVQVLPRLTTRPVGRTSVGSADRAIESLWGHRRILFRLPLVAGSTTVFQTTAASDGLYWVKPVWFRYFGDKVAGELEMIIDGHFCVAKSGLPMRPTYQQNYLSFEGNDKVKQALMLLSPRGLTRRCWNMSAGCIACRRLCWQQGPAGGVPPGAIRGYAGLAGGAQAYPGNIHKVLCFPVDDECLEQHHDQLASRPTRNLKISWAGAPASNTRDTSLSWMQGAVTYQPPHPHPTSS